MESWQRGQFVQARRGADCLGRGNTEKGSADGSGGGEGGSDDVRRNAEMKQKNINFC
jgi:hypothetical protein